MRAEEVRLGVLEPHAAIERRPFRLDAGVPRAAKEIQVVPAQRRARLFLGAVADARREPPMLALGDRRRESAPPGAAASCLPSTRCWRTGTAPSRTASAAIRASRGARRPRPSCNVSCRRTMFSPTLFSPSILIGPKCASNAGRRGERDPHLVAAGALLRDVDLRVRVARCRAARSARARARRPPAGDRAAFPPAAATRTRRNRCSRG